MAAPLFRRSCAGVSIPINFLVDSRPGYRPAGTPELRLWWCESGWKIGRLTVPIRVHIYNFQLPDQSHLKSAVGIHVRNINEYQRLKTAADKLGVDEEYLLNSAQH